MAIFKWDRILYEIIFVLMTSAWNMYWIFTPIDSMQIILLYNFSFRTETKILSHEHTHTHTQPFPFVLFSFIISVSFHSIFMKNRKTEFDELSTVNSSVLNLIRKCHPLGWWWWWWFTIFFHRWPFSALVNCLSLWLDVSENLIFSSPPMPKYKYIWIKVCVHVSVLDKLRAPFHSSSSQMNVNVFWSK